MSGIGLPGFDAWKTREPVERRYDPDIVFFVVGHSPHSTLEIRDGRPYDSASDAEAAANKWLRKMAEADPRYAEDYYYEIAERDLMEGCTCTSYRRDQWCPLHGRDPDEEYERFRDDGGS